jgi:hypothetical protein
MVSSVLCMRRETAKCDTKRAVAKNSRLRALRPFLVVQATIGGTSAFGDRRGGSLDWAGSTRAKVVMMHS